MKDLVNAVESAVYDLNRAKNENQYLLYLGRLTRANSALLVTIASKLSVHEVFPQKED